MGPVSCGDFVGSCLAGRFLVVLSVARSGGAAPAAGAAGDAGTVKCLAGAVKIFLNGRRSRCLPGLRRAAWVRAGYLPAVNRQVTGSILIAGACESCFCPAGMRGSLLGAGEACGAHPNPRRRPAAPAERRARVAAPPVLKEVGGIHPSILPLGPWPGQVPILAACDTREGSP